MLLNNNNKKRSFFERLAGGINFEEEERSIPVMMSALDDESSDDVELGEEGELSIDMHQTPAEVVIQAMIAGVKPGDLSVDISRDSVTIRGSRRASRTVSEEDYFHRELYWGAFSRTIPLPHEVDIEASEATEEHGLLTVRLPKLDKNRQTKLRIKSI